MPFNAKLKASRDALPKPEILATPLETNAVESCVLRAAGVTADTEGPYTGRRYMLAGTVLSKREDGTYEEYEATGSTEGVSEVQKITIKAGKGNWKAGYEGDETGNLPFNITAANLQAALEGLPGVEPGDITVTGGSGDATGTKPYFVTFKDPGNMAAITVADVSLEEGGDAAEAATVTAGVAEVEGSQAIAGILFETIEFADATSASNEPAAYVCWNVNFDKNKIVNFKDLEGDLLEWGSDNNCKFTDATQANV